jgi:hypothetical protein
MERKSKGIAFAAAIVAVVAILLVGMLAVLNRRNEIVGLNQEIQYDDFAFSVLEVRKAADLGKGDSRAAGGVYYVVAIKIANHAKRVDYTFKRASAILVDDTGREFHLSEKGQQEIESAHISKCADPIPAGASCTTEVVFQVPDGARPSQFRFSEAGSVGDILDFVFYGTKRINLSSVDQEGSITSR